MMLTLAPKSQIASGKLWRPIEIGMTGPLLVPLIL